MGHIDENSRGGSGHPRVNGSRTQLHLFYSEAIRSDPLPDFEGWSESRKGSNRTLAGRVERDYLVAFCFCRVKEGDTVSSELQIRTHPQANFAFGVLVFSAITASGVW